MAEAAIAAWSRANNPALPLRLNGLGLTAVPALPPTVQILLLQDNELAELPASLPPTLHTLDVTHNRLASLPATLPPSLHTLFAGYNQLTTLPSALPPALHTLSVQYNQLRALPPSLAVLPNLTLLVLSRNALTTLPTFLPPSLRHFRAEYNWLTVFPTFPDAIEEVWLDHNKIGELVGDLPDGLTRLSLTHNEIHRISHLSFNPDLQVRLEGNLLPIVYDPREETFYAYLVRLAARLQEELHSWY